MKVTGASGFDPQLRRFRGQFQTWNHPKYGPITAKWPRKRHGKRTPGQIDNNDTFAAVVGWCRSPISTEVSIAQVVTKNSGFLIRDLLEACCYGNVVIVQTKAGQIYYGARMVAQSAQALLDQITQDPGALLARTSEGWIALEPGVTGYVLTANGPSLAPTYQALPPPPTTTQDFITEPPSFGTASADSGAFATKGHLIACKRNFAIRSIYALLNCVVGATFTASVCTLNNSGSTPTVTAVATTPPITIGVAATERWQQFDLTTPFSLVAGSFYWLCVTETDGSATKVCPLYYPAAGTQEPIFDGYAYFEARLATLAPAVGQQPNTGAGTNWPYMIGFRWYEN
jgi:hypothetical protein